MYEQSFYINQFIQTKTNEEKALSNTKITGNSNNKPKVANTSVQSNEADNSVADCEMDISS